MDCALSVNQYWECTKLLGHQGGTITTCVSYANGSRALDGYPTVWYDQASAVPQEQCPQYAATRQTVLATQPNGPAFTSHGQKVLCKSACSPSISFTPLGQNRSTNKSSVVHQDKHSHKQQLPQLKFPSQNQESPEDVLGSLPNNQLPTVSCDSNPGSLLHGESPCPLPGIGKGTALTNNWVPKPDLVPCVSSSKTPTLSCDPLAEEMPHLHMGTPGADSSLLSLDQFEEEMLSLQKEISSLSKVIERLYQRSIEKAKALPVTRAQESANPSNNTTCIDVVDNAADNQPSLHFTGTDLTNSPSDNPCSPHVHLCRGLNHTASDPVKSLDFSQSCPDLSQDKTTCSLSSSMCQHTVPMQVLVPLNNNFVTSPSHCSGCNLGSCSNCVSKEEFISLLHRVEVLEKALQDITTLLPSGPVPTDVLNESFSHHNSYTAMDSVHGSVPNNSESNGSDLQWPLSPMAKVHSTPVDSGYQSPLVSPMFGTKPLSVASSPVPADQISLQGQLSDNPLHPDPPVETSTMKGCLHYPAKLCQSCQSAACTQLPQHDAFLDTSVIHSSTLIPVCDPVPRPDVQHLEPGAAKEDVNPDASTKDADGDVNRKTMGPDFAHSQVTSSCVTEPICMSIPSQVTSLGRDNFNGLPMNLGESLVPMGTGKQPVPSNPVRPNQSIPEYTPDDSCSQEVFYSFESSSGQGGLNQFSLDDCLGLIGQGQSHPFNNYFDCRNQEWSPLSSTPVTKMDPDPLNWVGLV